MIKITSSGGVNMSENFSYERFFEEGSEFPPPTNLRGVIALLKDAWRVYRTKFTTFLGILGIPICFALIYSDLFYLLSHTDFQYSPFFSLLQFLLTILLVLLFLCSIIALIYSFREDIALEEAYKRSWQLFASSIWVYFLLASIIAGGFILAIIPGIIFSVWFSLALFVLVFEERKGFAALARSKQLVGGRSWGVLGRLILILLLLGIIATAVVTVLTWRIDYVPLSQLVGCVTGYLLQIFILPFFLIYLFLIYEDIGEIKKEEAHRIPSLGVKLVYTLPGILGALCVCFGFALLVFSIFWGRDIPPIDDSDLRLSKIEIPKEQNAYYDFEEAIKKRFLPPAPRISPFPPPYGGPFVPPPPEGTNWEELFSDMLNGDRLRTKEADELMRRNEELLEHFANGLRRPYFQIPKVEDPEDFGAATLFPELSHLRELARWGVVQGNYLFAKGKEKEAFDWFLNVAKFSKMLENSPRPAGMIQYLVGAAINSIGLEGTRKRIGESNLPPEILKNYARKLEELAGDGEGLKRSFRMEYMMTSNSFQLVEPSLYWKSKVREMEEIYGEDVLYLPSILSTWARVYYKPNETHLEVAEFWRSMIREIDKTYKEMKVPNLLEKEKMEYFELEGDDCLGLGEEIKETLFRENSLGREMVETMTPVVSGIIETKCREKFQREALACLVALRAYQKAKGYLPTSLEELVPEYLSQVPIDPFDGEPLRYSREKRIIYCVGKDLKDSGGSIGEKGHWSTWKDPALSLGF